MRILFQKDHPVDNEKESRMWENLEAGDSFGNITRAWVQDDEGVFQGKDSKGGGE